MIDNILTALKKEVEHRIWIFSDLQQSIPERAQHCLSTAVEDFKQLNMECEQIWYLGDAVEGNDPERLQEMVQIQLELLKPLNTDLRYVLGNHDFDYVWDRKEKAEQPAVHFYEAVTKTPGWKTIDSLDSFYFTEEIGDYKVIFLSDHGDPQGRWVATHGLIHGDAQQYPHTEQDVLALRNEIENTKKRIITVSHGAFAGGNRSFELWNPLLPLPSQVKVHFYGHSHIGDAQWGKEYTYRKISYVNYQKMPQINVSSLENRRGDEIRSVILEIYADHTLGIYFRDHEKQEWADLYMLNDRR